MLIGLSIVIVKSDVKFRNIQHKRFSRSNEQIRTLRNLVGKLVDSETNAVYTMDGKKQQGIPWNSGATTVVPLSPSPPPTPEEIACLAACQSCVEDYPIESRKKKSANNCGPMCDCADSCFRMPVQQVGKIYGQRGNTDYGKECWWRTFSDMLTNDMLSSA
ncbi:unnamed protein product [Rotaria sp. Silwood2]|nr:unnamed protein product [Rotaria sp. Silwood2]CAF2509159.1 unnamed protein product [Rotaria sp. Silwood2]CAF2740814.1 unnamed protein product [Rotaria sp. Silwood2]CAF2881693.1 unnamed protein product [Rotaria sp. Silwood2]CAF3898426.1 unnamed protein product [Rotaria sp. Silwood2]